MFWKIGFSTNQEKTDLKTFFRSVEVEAAGIEPASRDVSRLASTCVVADLKFAHPAGRRHPEK